MTDAVAAPAAASVAGSVADAAGPVARRVPEVMTAGEALATVQALLGVPPGYPAWRVADIARRNRLLATWLSALRATGHDLPADPLAYLGRARARTESLYEVAAHAAGAHDVTVIKGAKIAAHLPAGVLRESGDVDIVAADQAALWRCVLDLRERHGAVPQTVSVLRPAGPGNRGGGHVGVALKWPFRDGYLDKPLGADVTTCAFSGDLRSVPVRAAPVEDTDLCSLFAVAEERFQRRFRARDLLDLVVLARVLDARLGERLPAAVADLAARLCLAPELAHLLHRTGSWVRLPRPWADVATALRPLAADEERRRRPDREGMHELRFGLPLDERPSGTSEVVIHPFDGGELARTPVGTCLLVASRTVAEDLYERACAEAAAL